MEYIMDINFYSLLYFVLLLITWCISILTKNHTCSSIGGAMLIAFFVTRGIKEYASGPSHMHDFANDLWVIAFIFLFFRADLIGKLILGTYVMMIGFAYLPKALELGISELYYETLNSIAALQILILLGGNIHGYRRNRSIVDTADDEEFEHITIDYCNVDDSIRKHERSEDLGELSCSPYLDLAHDRKKK